MGDGGVEQADPVGEFLENGILGDVPAEGGDVFSPIRR
jgi:hypothetical protein